MQNVAYLQQLPMYAPTYVGSGHRISWLVDDTEQSYVF